MLSLLINKTLTMLYSTSIDSRVLSMVLVIVGIIIAKERHKSPQKSVILRCYLSCIYYNHTNIIIIIALTSSLIDHVSRDYFI